MPRPPPTAQTTAQPTRRQLLAAGAASLPPARAQSGWPAIEQAARGQTVFWNARAGSEQTNACLQWAARQVQALFGVMLQFVKITGTANVADAALVVEPGHAR